MVAKFITGGDVDALSYRFNPCSGGLWLLSGVFIFKARQMGWFQSLFWWMMVAKLYRLYYRPTALIVSILVLVDYGC